MQIYSSIATSGLLVSESQSGLIHVTFDGSIDLNSSQQFAYLRYNNQIVRTTGLDMVDSGDEVPFSLSYATATPLTGIFTVTSGRTIVEKNWTGFTISSTSASSTGGGTSFYGINTSMNGTTTCEFSSTDSTCLSSGYDYTTLFGFSFLIALIAIMIVLQIFRK